MNISLLGIDLAKNVFHLHGVDEKGREVFKKRVFRGELLETIANLKRCRIALEACGGANYWSREFEKLGHKVDLIAPQYVKPYVKRNKNDFKDAEAICEAARRPTMRYVPRRSESQQDVQNLHRIRERLVKERTALVNETRGLLQEYGIVLPQGIREFQKKFLQAMNENEDRLSALARDTFYDLWGQFLRVEDLVKGYERKLKSIAKETPTCQRLMTIPGVGYLTATAMVAAIADARAFKNGRELAAWLGLTPREYSTGGKQRLFGISKRGDTYLRKLLIHGARVTCCYLHKHQDKRSAWAADLLERKGRNRTAVALANKNARTIWAMIVREENYRELPLAA